MSEPGFAMNGGFQEELDFGDLPDPYEDLEPDLDWLLGEDEDDEEEEILKECD